MKKYIQAVFNLLGLEVRRIAPGSFASLQLLKAFEKFNVDVVLDVGANTGQFSSDLRKVGFKGKMVSFEPLSLAHEALTKTSSGDPLWSVHPRCAIGDFDGEIEIHLAGNSVSSSVLPMLKLHSEAAVGSAYVGSEKVAIKRLETVAHGYMEGYLNPFLKIDTQGFEWQVLDGAESILPKFRGLLCELSLVPLYENQRLWMDIVNRLEGQGFKLWGVQQGFVDPRDGRTLQMDGIFFRD